jgi:hypothetical protein
MIKRGSELRLIFILLIWIPINLFGQQYFLNNQRNWNDLMFNPAKIVETSGKTIYTTYRRQFVGLGSNSPYIAIVGAKSNLPVNYSLNILNSDKQKKKKQNYNLAVGTYYIHSNYGGVFDQNEICGQFAFQLKFDQDKFDPNDFNQLNFGIAVKGVNMRYRGSGLDLIDPSDPVFNQFQAENSFSLTIIPGFQLLTRKVNIDALFNFGSVNEQFGSLTLSGSNQIDNIYRLMSLRVNYFNANNIQLSLNKIIDFRTVFQHNWAMNFGINAILNEMNNTQFLSNPGIYIGFIYRTNSEPIKTRQEFRKPMKYNSFSGSLNLVDVNFNTFPLGPSSEIGLQYSRNNEACECDQIYDDFISTNNKNSNGSELSRLKEIETNFSNKCNTREYQLCFVKFRNQMRDIIDSEEEKISEEEEITLDYPTLKLFNQEWYCSNLYFYKGTGIKLITNQEDWDKYSPTSPCCCYIGFDEKNKNKGLCYNKKAYLLLASSQELKNSKFRIATANDWKQLFDNAKRAFATDQLYNCDGKNPNSFNIHPSGYYEYDWMYLDMAISAYWVGESDVYSFDCNSKEGLLIIDIDNDEVAQRNESSAFMIRLIKK